MAELHECLLGMARRESVLRTQLEEASAEHAIALSRATDLTEREASASAAAASATEKAAAVAPRLDTGIGATATAEKAAVAAGLEMSAAQMRADLGAELGSQLRDGLAQGLAQAQQGVLHMQSDLQSAREERERHDAELVALRTLHSAQIGTMQADVDALRSRQRTVDAELEQALGELRRRLRGRMEM